MATIAPSDRYQQELFSSLNDRVEEFSIVRVIDLLLDKLYESMDQKPTRKSDVGAPEYPRKLLLKLFVYGYMNRVKSSRRLERECKVNLEVIWLMGRLQPDHWTISNFRKENLEEIRRIIKQFIKFLKDTGYIEGKTIVVDGTKLKANARSMGNLDIKEIKERIEDTDNKISYYLSNSEEQENNQQEIERLKKELEELRAQIDFLKKEKKKIYIKGDPDSAKMKTTDGKKAGYNVQISTDAKNKLIVATDVSSQANDFGQLKNMDQKTREMLDEKPEEYLADAGYYRIEDIEEIERQGIHPYVSELPEQSKGTFSYDGEKDEYTCKNNKKLRFESRRIKRGRKERVYRCNDCRGCPFREDCTTSKNGRIKIRYENQEFRDNFRMRMGEEESRKKLKLRGSIVEHPFGIMKNWLGKDPLLLRGLPKVSTEISILSISYNILRLFNISGYEELVSKIRNYNWVTA